MLDVQLFVVERLAGMSRPAIEGFAADGLMKRIRMSGRNNEWKGWFPSGSQGVRLAPDLLDGIGPVQRLHTAGIPVIRQHGSLRSHIALLQHPVHPTRPELACTALGGVGMASVGSIVSPPRRFAPGRCAHRRALSAQQAGIVCRTPPIKCLFVSSKQTTTRSERNGRTLTSSTSSVRVSNTASSGGCRHLFK